MIREEKQGTLLASKVVGTAAVACLIMIRNYSLDLTVSLRVYAAAFSGRPDMIKTCMARLHCLWVSVCP